MPTMTSDEAHVEPGEFRHPANRTSKQVQPSLPATKVHQIVHFHSPIND
jgi:hypothetical protein